MRAIRIFMIQLGDAPYHRHARPESSLRNFSLQK